MKKPRKSLAPMALVFLFIILRLPSNLLSAQAFEAGQEQTALKISQGELHGKKVVKISFNGVSKGTGSLKVLDSAGSLVLQQTEIDLLEEPFFYAISCDGLPAGDCTFYVKTVTTEYKSTITLR